MKEIIIFAFLILLTSVNFSQTQQRIEWPSIADTPWPTLKGDMQGTGRSEFVGPRTSNVLWELDLPLGIYRGPIIGYNEILYFGTSSIDPDLRNHFYGYYNNGIRFWEYETFSGHANSFSPLVLRDSSVLMGSDIVDLYAFTHYGNLKWKTRVGDGFAGEFAVSKEGDIYTITDDTLIVIDSAGIIKLKKPIENIISRITFSPDGNTIYFKTGSQNSSLNAADLYGNIKWKKNLKSNRGHATIDNQGNIYVFGKDTLSDLRYLYSFDSSGVKRWEYPIKGFYLYSTISIDFQGNLLFTCQIEINAIPYLVSLNYNGIENWRVNIDPDNTELWPDEGVICDAEGKIYFGSSTAGDYFYCFDSEGQLLWKYQLFINSYDTNPAIGSDGTIYIGSHNSIFYSQGKKTLIAIKDAPNAIGEEIAANDFVLFQNYPNPFNPTTVISYNIPKEGFVSLKVYDVLGREVETLISQNKPRGKYSINFNAKNLSSGIYFYELKINSYRAIRTMVFVR